MRITPEAFIEEQKEKSYEELLSVRDELIGVIRKFEADDEQDPEDVLVSPLPDGNYYCNLKLLVTASIVLVLAFVADVVYSHYVPNIGEGITDYDEYKESSTLLLADRSSDPGYHQ